MYDVQLTAEAQDTLEALDARSRRSVADFVAAVSSDPYIGGLYMSGGDQRLEAIDDGDLLVLWMIPDEDRVVILRLVSTGPHSGS